MEMSRGSIHALCDDALAEILILLDAPSLVRCRAVCRSWHRIATDRSFLVAHAARRPREMIVKTEHGFARSAIVPPDEVAAGGDRRRRYLVFDPRPRPKGAGRTTWHIEPRASLDGLVVLEKRCFFPYRGPGAGDVSSYIICNPVTRHWANLPPLCPATIIASASSCFDEAFHGFYFHASSDEYRLLFRCIIYPWSEEISPSTRKETYFCVVSAGCTLPRRLVTCGPVLDEDELRFPPVYCHGTLHWLLSQHHIKTTEDGMTKDEITAFDTVSETFRFMSLPPGLGRTRAARRGLLELDGELSVATMPSDVTLDIWALQDYDEKVGWTLRHRMNVQPPSLSSLFPTFKSLSVGSSAILTSFPIADEVRLYSLKEGNGDGVQVHREIIYRGCPTFVVFSESLVHHAFFDLPRCPEMVRLRFSANPLFNEDDDE